MTLRDAFKLFLLELSEYFELRETPDLTVPEHAVGLKWTYSNIAVKNEEMGI